LKYNEFWPFRIRGTKFIMIGVCFQRNPQRLGEDNIEKNIMAKGSNFTITTLRLKVNDIGKAQRQRAS